MPQNKIQSDFDEYTHEGPGSESVTLAFSEPNGSDCTWQVDVFAKLRDAGDLHTSDKAWLGSFTFGPAGALDPKSRVLATASLPGAERWYARVSRLTGTTWPATYTIDVMPGRCKCSNGGAPGLTVFVARAAPP